MTSPLTLELANAVIAARTADITNSFPTHYSRHLVSRRRQRAAQQAGSVKTLFGRAKDWFLGNF